MEALARQLKDNRVAEELFDILNRKKTVCPFQCISAPFEIPRSFVPVQAETT